MGSKEGARTSEREKGGRKGEPRERQPVYVIASCVNMIVGSRPGAYLRTKYAT